MIIPIITVISRIIFFTAPSGHSSHVLACTFSKDGRTLWSGGGSDCSIMQVLLLLLLLLLRLRLIKCSVERLHTFESSWRLVAPS